MRVPNNRSTMGMMQLDDHGWVFGLTIEPTFEEALFMFVIPLFMGESFESLLKSYFCLRQYSVFVSSIGMIG